jgi:hypothetical protein
MLDDGDYYLEGGLLVLTEQYHRKRGTCCGSGCRHCPYDHIAVPKRDLESMAPSGGERGRAAK